MVSDMKPMYLQLGLACFVCSLMGCAMCCGPYDYDYPNFGGKHQRSDRSYGRVGSIFSDPMASPMGGSADSNLKAPEPRKRGESNPEDTDEAQELRDKIKQELEEKDPDDSDPKSIETQVRPDPDTKEALRRIQHPGSFNQWR
jgi:hypothetical protein